MADIGVIGVPDPETDERVVAFVEPAPGVEVTDDLAGELATFAREHPAGDKVPRDSHFREALPRPPTGKMVMGKLPDEHSAAVS